MKINLENLPVEPLEFLAVETARMGSCQCGDCLCRVYADGEIAYAGGETWQRSEKRKFLWDEEPSRKYNSQLGVRDYRETVAELQVHNAKAEVFEALRKLERAEKEVRLLAPSC